MFMFKGDQIVRSFDGVLIPGDEQFLGWSDPQISNQRKKIREFLYFSMGERSMKNARLISGSREEGFYFFAMPGTMESNMKNISLYVADFKIQTSVYGMLMTKWEATDIMIEHLFYNSNRKTIRKKEDEVVKHDDVKHIVGPTAQMLFAAQRHERAFISKKTINIILTFVHWQRKYWQKFAENDYSVTYCYSQTRSHQFFVKFIKKVQTIEGKDAFVAEVTRPRGRNSRFDLIYFIDNNEIRIPNIK